MLTQKRHSHTRPLGIRFGLMDPFRYLDLSRRQRAFLYLLLLVSNAIGSFELAQSVSRYFIATFFVGLLLFAYLLMSLRCPKCGTPIMKNELHLFGINTHMWMPIPRKTCADCGARLD